MQEKQLFLFLNQLSSYQQLTAEIKSAVIEGETLLKFTVCITALILPLKATKNDTQMHKITSMKHTCTDNLLHPAVP